MPPIDYEIVVVDANPKPFPAAKDLVKSGVPLSVAARWAKVRREMSSAGLKRKIALVRN